MSVQNLQWQLGAHDALQAVPETFFPAQVPGAVQLDYARANNWPPFWRGENFRQFDGLEDRFWTYRANVPALDFSSGKRHFFVAKSIDYAFQIRVNGELRHEQEGMFTPVEIELFAGDQTLEITIFPAPKYEGAHRNRAEAAYSAKPAVSYGWDWHPRLIPLGIADECGIETRSATFLSRAEVFSALNDDFSIANLRLEAEIEGETSGFATRWTLLSPDGNVVFETEGSSARIENPQLWWTHDHGTPALYTSKVELLNAAGETVDEKTAKVGLRRVRLVRYEGAWEAPLEFPKTCNEPPITLELNGRKIFSKGSNFVNADIFPGAVTDETLRRLVELGVEANFNLFRMWGGAPVQKEAFWQACDELGILVWQEFPLACNNYPDDESYLRVLDAESRAIIVQLRSHPSLAFWCGGNELFNSWSGMDDQSHALRLLNRNCFDLDKNSPFLPTSPVFGMAHGGYFFFDPDTGREGWEIFQSSQNTAYTEFGCPGPSPVEVLKTFLPAEELFPPRPGTSWESHHAFGVWQESSWLCLDTLENYFGPSENLEELVERGELLQCEGYKGLFEEARRQKPRSSMALNWCYNDCWPTAANNSLLSWPTGKKPAFEAVKSACRPTLTSAKISKFLWREGELFDAQLWLLHDAYESFEGTEIEAILKADEREISILTWKMAPLEANQNQAGPRVGFTLPLFEGDRFELHLRCAAQPQWNSVYTLGFRSKKARKKFHGDALNF